MSYDIFRRNFNDLSIYKLTSVIPFILWFVPAAALCTVAQSGLTLTVALSIELWTQQMCLCVYVSAYVFMCSKRARQGPLCLSAAAVSSFIELECIIWPFFGCVQRVWGSSGGGGVRERESYVRPSNSVDRLDTVILLNRVTVVSAGRQWPV